MEVTWQQVEKALDTLQPTQGGFTSARCGIVTLGSGDKLFVKLAVDEQTSAWIDLEKKAYSWLAAHSYAYAPPIIAEGKDGFALPDLSHLDWSNEWTTEKLDVALKAMDTLALLSNEASDTFEHYDDINYWPDLPDNVGEYQLASNDKTALTYVKSFLTGSKREQLTIASDNHPEHGETLVHLDVRADNFCYDRKARHGYLIDWNWLCLANEALDVNGLLVSVAQRGFDVSSYANTKDRLDGPSLASLIGFWLAGACRAESDSKAAERHKQQFEAAVTALKLYEHLQV